MSFNSLLVDVDQLEGVIKINAKKKGHMTVEFDHPLGKFVTPLRVVEIRISRGEIEIVTDAPQAKGPWS